MPTFWDSAGGANRKREVSGRSPPQPLAAEPFLFSSDMEETRWCRELYARFGKQFHNLQQQVFTQCKKFIEATGQEEAMDLNIEAALTELDEVHSRDVGIHLRMTEQKGARFFEHRAQLLWRRFAPQSDLGFK
jgi:hypothetical protein